WQCVGHELPSEHEFVSHLLNDRSVRLEGTLRYLRKWQAVGVGERRALQFLVVGVNDERVKGGGILDVVRPQSLQCFELFTPTVLKPEQGREKTIDAVHPRPTDTELLLAALQSSSEAQAPKWPSQIEVSLGQSDTEMALNEGDVERFTIVGDQKPVIGQ